MIRSFNSLECDGAFYSKTMDVLQMDIQRLPSFEVMIVTATWICAS